MARLYPFSPVTADRLRSGPAPGATHLWLAQVAAGLRGCLPEGSCRAFLVRCCADFVRHRVISEREIEGALRLAYRGSSRPSCNFGRGSVAWPVSESSAIARVLESVNPLFDCVGSLGLRPEEVLPGLFSPGALLCYGYVAERGEVGLVSEILWIAEKCQFIVPNPMRGVLGVTREGRPSARCQSNVLVRRYLVAEFDDAALDKVAQARLVSALADLAPLVLVVDSGGKSLHAWFRVEDLSRKDQVRFFAVACVLGADPTRWDLCGWVRMPGGLRARSDGSFVRQRVLYFGGSQNG